MGYNASPTLADIDGDGDLDAFVGADDGHTIFFANECCGNGAPDTTEQCDDGNREDGDCCSSACQWEALDSPCGDADVCNGEETCDGLGTCAPGAPLDRADADLCTQDSCDPTLGCQNLAEPATTCADTWRKGSLLIEESVPGKEKLIVKMSKGPALAQSDFGDPLDAGGTAYTACVYDDAVRLVGSMKVDRAGQTCGTKDCWKQIGAPSPNGRGYLYEDREGSSDGITRLKLKGGAAGKSRVQIKGANKAAKGLLSLPVGLAAGLTSSDSATVQIFGTDSPECFSLTVDDIEKQKIDLFKGAHPLGGACPWGPTRSDCSVDSAVSFECDFRLSGKLRDDPARILVGSLGGGSKWRRYLDAFSPFASPGHCLTVESRG